VPVLGAASSALLHTAGGRARFCAVAVRAAADSRALGLSLSVELERGRVLEVAKTTEQQAFAPRS
jgi:hypothetical protein